MIELTKTAVTQIIHTGIGEHSSIASDYIDKVKEQYDINIVACYLQTSQILRFPKTRKDAHLENSLTLTVYLRKSQRELDINKERYSGLLLECFFNVLSSRGESIEYNRSYTPEEMDYYGWTNKRSSEWDYEKVIYPKGPITESKEILIESFDGLAIWHYLFDRLRAINRLPSVNDLSATIYCGWDKKALRENLYVILPENKSVDNDKLKKECFKKEALDCLYSADKFGLFSEENFNPIYVHWSELSEKVKFELLRR